MREELPILILNYVEVDLGDRQTVYFKINLIPVVVVGGAFNFGGRQRMLFNDGCEWWPGR